MTRSICGRRFGCSYKGRLFDPLVRGVRWAVGGRGWVHSIACPWVHISSPLTHMVYLLPFSSYLAGPKSVSSRPSDPETMTNIALEATAYCCVEWQKRILCMITTSQQCDQLKQVIDVVFGTNSQCIGDRLKTPARKSGTMGQIEMLFGRLDHVGYPSKSQVSFG